MLISIAFVWQLSTPVVCFSEGEDAVLAIAEIITELEGRQAELSQLHVVVDWKDRKDGMVVGWEQSIIDRDSIGRIKYSSKSGTFDDQGNQVVDKDLVRLFDAVNTVNFDYKYDPQLGQSKGHLVHATLFDKPFPEPDGPLFLRSPANDILGGVIKGLRESELAHRHVPSRMIDVDGSKLLEVQFQRTVNPSPTALRWTGLIDTAKDWSVVELFGESAEGLIRNKSTATYRVDESGKWVPDSGTWRTFAANGQEQRGSDFLCADIRITELGADEELFSIRVPDGAYVNFVPLNVVFVANSELVGFEAIRAAASNASSKMQSELRPIPEPAQLNNDRQVPMKLLLLGNFGLLVIIVGFWIIGRLRDR